MAYGNNYYEADRAVVRNTTGPYDTAYTPGCVDPMYPRHHHNGMNTVVSEVVAAKAAVPVGGYGYGPIGRHQYGRPATTEFVEERIIENNAPYGSCRTSMY